MTTFNNIFRCTNMYSACYKGVFSNRINNLYNNTLVSGYAKSAEEKLGIQKPKRPLVPFFRFATQIKPTLTSKHPGASMVDISKIAAEHWKHLDAEAKAKLNKEYEEDLKDYNKMKELYDRSLTQEQKEDIKKMQLSMAAAKEKRKTKAENKELGRPKRPMSSFFLFLQTEKGNAKEGGFKAYFTEMKAKWDKLSPEARAELDKKCEASWITYRKELASWEEKMIKMGNEHLVRKGPTPRKRKDPLKKGTNP